MQIIGVSWLRSLPFRAAIAWRPRAKTNQGNPTVLELRAQKSSTFQIVARLPLRQSRQALQRTSGTEENVNGFTVIFVLCGRQMWRNLYFRQNRASQYELCKL